VLTKAHHWSLSRAYTHTHTHITYLLTYSLTQWCRILFENLIVTQLVKKHPAFFMENEGSLPCSQKPVTGPYPEHIYKGTATVYRVTLYAVAVQRQHLSGFMRYTTRAKCVCYSVLKTKIKSFSSCDTGLIIQGLM
jgi:hypothetical protein